MYEDLLVQAPLFRDLPRRELTWLGEACRERDYAAGEELMRPGGGWAGLTLIIEGRARVVERQGDMERELGIWGAGAVFGESAVFEDGPCSITVSALEQTRALVLPTWDLRATLREYPDIAIHLLAILGRRLRARTPADHAT